MRMIDLAFVGTRTTEKRSAHGRGIEVFDASSEPWVHLETVPAVNPSYLVLDRKRSVLHAVHGDMSELSSYAVHIGEEAHADTADVRPGRILEPLGERNTRGTNPAHIVTDPSGDWLVVTNHTSGSVATFRIRDDGTAAEAADVLTFTGEPGPFSADQSGAKPHQVVFFEAAETVSDPAAVSGADPAEGASIVPAEGAGTDAVAETKRSPSRAHFLVPDKGLDTVFKCMLDLTTGVMEVVDEIRLRQGSGPRHLVVDPHADRVYVLGELGNTVTVIAGAKSSSPGAMKATQIVPSLPECDVRDSRGGEIVLGRDGTTLWATNRSGAGDASPGGPDEDTAAVWDIGENGQLTLRTHAGTGGVRPRFAAFDPRRPGLDVALERSHQIVRVEERSTEPVVLAEVKSPVCIVFGAETSTIPGQD